MIAYVTLGANDLTKSAEFYDPIFAELGAKRIMETDRYVAYGRSMTDPMILITKPWDGSHATSGNGTMVALACKDKSQVDAVHAMALKQGASNEGDAGVRGDRFYCGYFRDPDNNKLNAFCFA